MRNSTFIAIVIAGILGVSSIATESKAQRVSVNFSVFQNELGRYGRWTHHPRFGEVWIYNEPGFRPYYSNGNWDYTEYGWEWISDYDWGWAPFHYGRWEMDPYYGWIWIPGYEWAPAWVSWSEYGDYYGWAPLGYGLSINISIGSIPYDRWNFCSRPYINQRSFRDYCVPFAQNRNIYRNVTIINNYYGERNGRYSAGPQRRDAERYFGRNIETHHYDRENRYQRRDNDNRRSTPYVNNDNRYDNRNGNRNNGNGFGNSNGNGNNNGYNNGNGRGNDNGRGNGYNNGNGNSNGNGNGYDNRNGNGNNNGNGNTNRQENRNRNEYEIRNNDRRNRDFNPRNNESERPNTGTFPGNNQRNENNVNNGNRGNDNRGNDNNRNNGQRIERPDNTRNQREYTPPPQNRNETRRESPAREERGNGQGRSGRRG